MYSYEDRLKAVKLYIKYSFCVADTLHELGYPSRNMLRQWYQEYTETGELHKLHGKKSKYSLEARMLAVRYYMEHGRNMARTIKAIGYPHRETMREWIHELAPNEQKVYSKHSSMIKYTSEQKKEAVIEINTGDSSVVAVAKTLGANRASLYKWEKKLLGERCIEEMKHENRPPLPGDRDALLAEVESLKKQIYHLQMEHAILEKAVEIVKKGRGINPRELVNAEKARLIDALREEFPLKELLIKLHLSKSSYFYQRKSLTMPSKYSTLRVKVKEFFENNQACYGYRRIHALMKNIGDTVSEKIIRRIMKEEQLSVPLKRRRIYSSYQGEISPAVENLVARDFHADAPNKKWLTDLTEFHVPAGKVYLSPIIDCFDGLVVSWTVGTSPDAELVNTMLDEAIHHLTRDERPMIHSDRGCHYRWPGWISRMGKAGLTRSMSKKGCSPDNSACEGFFGRLKNEMFYNRSWQDVSIEQFVNMLNRYIRWYNEKRIKMSLGAMSPIDYRRSIGLVA
jgi:putative transposase